MIQLDTSAVVDLLRERDGRRKSKSASELLVREGSESIGVSLYVLCELSAGIEKAKRSEIEREAVSRLLAGVEVVAPEPTSFAARYGSILAALDRTGTSIATMDLLIAVTAVETGARLMTRDRRHFDRVPGLSVLAYD